MTFVNTVDAGYKNISDIRTSFGETDSFLYMCIDNMPVKEHIGYKNLIVENILVYRYAILTDYKNTVGSRKICSYIRYVLITDLLVIKRCSYKRYYRL